MTDSQSVTAIVNKYNQSISELAEKGTTKELKTVLTHIANQSNKRQRQLVGLED